MCENKTHVVLFLCPSERVNAGINIVLKKKKKMNFIIIQESLTERDEKIQFLIRTQETKRGTLS